MHSKHARLLLHEHAAKTTRKQTAVSLSSRSQRDLINESARARAREREREREKDKVVFVEKFAARDWVNKDAAPSRPTVSINRVSSDSLIDLPRSRPQRNPLRSQVRSRLGGSTITEVDSRDLSSRVPGWNWFASYAGPGLLIADEHVHDYLND